MKQPTTNEICEWLESVVTMSKHDAHKVSSTYLTDAVKFIRAQEAQLAELTKDAEPVAHIYPWDLERFKTQETHCTVFSVAVGCADGESVPLYTHPPAPKAITASNVDADIEYWRQKYLKLDAMYDELEKEKIAIEQNLMDRT